MEISYRPPKTRGCSGLGMERYLQHRLRFLRDGIGCRRRRGKDLTVLQRMLQIETEFCPIFRCSPPAAPREGMSIHRNANAREVAIPITQMTVDQLHQNKK